MSEEKVVEKSTIIKLIYPISLEQEGGAKTIVEEVTLGRLKAKHLKLLPAGFSSEEEKGLDPASMLPLIAAVANPPIAVIEEMDMQDMMVILEEIGRAHV